MANDNERFAQLEQESLEIADELDPLDIILAIQMFCDYLEIDPVEALDRIIEAHGDYNALVEYDRVILNMIETSQSTGNEAVLPEIRRVLEIQFELDNRDA